MSSNMACVLCALKHVSAGISYAKEVLSGHGKGSQLDHRIDFLGQIINLEHHLQALNNALYMEIKQYRQNVQENEVNLSFSDIDYLRVIYLKIEKTDEETKKLQTGFIETEPCVLFLHVKDKAFFNVCYKKLKENLQDHTGIFYLNTDIDLSGYDIKKINYNDIKEEYVYIIDEKQILLRKHTAKSLLRLADHKQGFNYSAVLREVKQPHGIFYYDDFPCLVKKDDFQPYADKENPLSIYCNKYKLPQVRAFTLTVTLNKAICCTNRQRLKTAIYTHVQNEQALQSLKKQIHID